MHTAVHQSHYEWPRCSQATHEIQFTTNANEKIGVTICKPKFKSYCVVGTEKTESSWTDINIFLPRLGVKMKKDHIKVLIKFTNGSIQTSLKQKKRPKCKVWYHVRLCLFMLSLIFKSPFISKQKEKRSD